jgi:putative redox protein
MADTIRVTHEQDDSFDIAIRGHTLSVDQPADAGGSDTAPTPTELFVASLAACVGFYARRFMARHDLSSSGLAVEATYTMAGGPARVGEISVTLCIPEGIGERDRAALLAVASHCTVHNTLARSPLVGIELSTTCARSAA